MLDLLDSILAFSAVMLGVSLLITVLVQILSGALNLRGWALKAGLTELFVQSGLDRKLYASGFAKKILEHPLISDSSLPSWVPHWTQASAIRKDELLRLITNNKELGLKLEDQVKDKLDKVTGMVGDWFDGQMDRVSQVFALWSRVITIGVSFVVAFALHLDAAYLLERMFSDTDTRAKLVAGVSTLEERAKRLGVAAIESPDAGASASVDAETSASGDAGAGDLVDAGAPGSVSEEDARRQMREASAEIKGIREDLAAAGVELLPKFAKPGKDGKLPPPDFAKAVHLEGDHFPWKWPDTAKDEKAWTSEAAANHFLGILAAGALLSLGAPFWFNLLKQLTNLRTVVAKKEEEERKNPTTGASA